MVPALHYWTFLALLLAGLAVWGWVIPSATPRRRIGSPRTSSVMIICACIIASLFAQLFVIAQLAYKEPVDWLSLPLIPPPHAQTEEWIGIAIGTIAVVQSILLTMLFLSLRDRTVSRVVWVTLGTSFTVMLAASMLSRYMSNQDIYLYTAFGHLGMAAYNPPPIRFSLDMAPLNHVLETPVIPCAYGPLWLLVATVVAHLFHGLAAEVFMFRILSAISLILCIWLLMRLSDAPATVALFALNPAVMNQYVVDAHNDLIGLAFLLAATLIARNRIFLAVLFVAAAGAAKLPYALIGAVIFNGCGPVTYRILPAVAACTIAVVATHVGSRGQYFHAAALASTYQLSHDPIVFIPHQMTAIACGLIIAAAVCFRRFARSGAYSVLSLGATTLPWYAVWAFPYVLAEGTFTAIYLITLPLTTFYFTTLYTLSDPTRALYLAISLSPVAVILFGIFQRRAVRGRT